MAVEAPPYLVKITYTARDRTKRQGTGIFISATQVLTCYHVLKREGDAGPAKTMMLEGIGKAKYVRHAGDLALLETKAQPDVVIPAWHLEGLRKDDPVVSLGFPGGEFDRAEHRVHHVSGQRLQLTGTLDPGASGGVLECAVHPHYLCVGMLQYQTVDNSGAIPAEVIAGFVKLPTAPLPRKAAKPHNPAKYLAWLRETTAHIDIRGLKAPANHEGKKKKLDVQEYKMAQLYIPLLTQAGEMRKPEPLEEAVRGHRQLVIQGDAGSGKSTFLRYLAGLHCRVGSKGFPLLISIARLDQFIEDKVGKPHFPSDAESPGWLALYLEAEGGQSGRNWGGLDAAFFCEKLEHAETLVLLDGLDEAANTERREHMARLFEAARVSYPACRWVVTTRPGAYEGKSTLRGFAVTGILDLEPDQIEKFLRQWTLCLRDNKVAAAEEELQSLQRDLAQSPPKIRRLARNPLMLSALAVVHYNDKKLPDQRADLYECILLWLADTRPNRRKEKARVGAKQMLELCGHLAFAMQDYQGRYETLLGREAAMEILRQKDGELDAETFLAEEEVDSGILTSEGNAIKFYHRSYQEFLAARHLRSLRATTRWQRVEPVLERSEWRETLVLLAGLLPGDWLDEFLEELVEFGKKLQQLARRARVLGLVGAMLADLESAQYRLSARAEPGYQKLRDDVMRIFAPDGVPELGVKTRADVADALAQGRDPRLRLPPQEGYFVSAQGIEIGRFPVTVYEYAEYVNAGGEEPGEWEAQQETPSRPVTRVNWLQATAYATWVKGVRLPTDAEWESVASGGGERTYPWGKAKPTEKLANFLMKVGRPTAVGLFPDGNTPEGVADLAGNVWEWTQENSVRGGSFGYEAVILRAAFRLGYQPDRRLGSLGFRLVRE